VRHSQEEHTYSGTGHYEENDQTRWFVLRDGDVVVEIPLGRFDPELVDLKADARYDVTVLDENSEDLQTDIAIIGHREHVDWNDAIDEAHSSFQQLPRISTAGKVVFNRSICSVHHIKMEKRNVEVAYGMLAHSKAESYCSAHYPNFRDYAVGGCIVGDAKSTSIYVCPKCVEECNNSQLSVRFTRSRIKLVMPLRGVGLKATDVRRSETAATVLICNWCRFIAALQDCIV